jgi:hypothetical protein
MIHEIKLMLFLYALMVLKCFANILSQCSSTKFQIASAKLLFTFSTSFFHTFQALKRGFPAMKIIDQ